MRLAELTESEKAAMVGREILTTGVFALKVSHPRVLGGGLRAAAES